MNAQNAQPVSSRERAKRYPVIPKEKKPKLIDEVLHPGEVGVAARGKAELMSLIVLTLPASRPCRCAPLPARVVVFAELVGVVEGRIGKDEVGAQIGMEIAPEGVGLLFAEIGFDAAKAFGVHHGEAAGSGGKHC
ncbi:MAG TPA: hypothetical protein VK993_10760 [Chthoniobacterales bacterium]|nr:hypothetical protein [Chthoniobacterales bacterium]